MFPRMVWIRLGIGVAVVGFVVVAARNGGYTSGYVLTAGIIAVLAGLAIFWGALLSS